MSWCAGLGSLLGKICDSCSLSISCNCSKTIIVGSVPNQQDLELVQRVIQDTDRDLERITQLFQRQTAPIGAAAAAAARPLPEIEHEAKPQAKVDSEHSHATDLGILKIANHFLELLREEGGTLEEAWARLHFAGYLSGVNLQTMLKEQEPLTKDEWKKLHKKVLLVKQYASHAVLLWKIVHSYGDDLVALRGMGILSHKQFQLLKAKKQLDLEFTRGATFSALSPGVRAAFLEGAQHFSSKYFELNGERFESMITPDLENNALLIHEHDRSGNSSPRLDSLKRIGMSAAAAAAAGAAEERAREGLEALYAQMGGVEAAMEEDVKKLRSALGMLRVKVIAYRMGVDPNSLHENPAEIERIRREGESLRRIEGSILYLFQSLKETIHLELLLVKEGITKPFLENLILVTRPCPEFFYSIKKAGELAALSPKMIALLWTLADLFTPEQKAQFNRGRGVQDWIAIEREHSPSLPGVRTSSEEEEEEEKRGH